MLVSRDSVEPSGKVRCFAERLDVERETDAFLARKIPDLEPGLGWVSVTASGSERTGRVRSQ